MSLTYLQMHATPVHDIPFLQKAVIQLKHLHFCHNQHKLQCIEMGFYELN